MVLANKWIEALGQQDRYYPGMDVFYVKKPNNIVEKHYYKVDERGVVDVQAKEIDALKNPTIKSDEKVSIEAKTKRNVYQWLWGSPFAYPLLSNEKPFQPILRDQDADQIFDLGREFEKLSQNKTENPDYEGQFKMMLMLLVIMSLAIAFMVYRIADVTGALKGLLGGTG